MNLYVMGTHKNNIGAMNENNDYIGSTSSLLVTYNIILWIS